jgi:phosphoenolpyruvate carboxylase
MKYQRDNSKVTVTQEMRDQEQKEKEEKAKKEQEFYKKRAKEVKDRMEVERQYHEAVQPAYDRENSYPPLSEQLDMLWHDMDTGIIKVDKRKANTWYKTIKKAKESTPLNKTWQEDIMKAQEKLEASDLEAVNNSNKGV